jgi:4-hydroxyphenylpyruvate dioxygenase-like putative hemolysin
MGCHPSGAGPGDASGVCDISFYCDDIEKTVAELTGRGVEFTTPIEDYGYGLVTYLKAPGDFQIQLYQPKYSKARA